MWEKEVCCGEEGLDHQLGQEITSSVSRYGGGEREGAAPARPERELTNNVQLGMNHEIVLIPSVGQSGREQLLQQCYDVRIDVFHHEQGFPLDTEIDKLCLAVPSVVKGLLISAPSQTRRDS